MDLVGLGHPQAEGVALHTIFAVYLPNIYGTLSGQL